jgi:hypothetical protein
MMDKIGAHPKGMLLTRVERASRYTLIRTPSDLYAGSAGFMEHLLHKNVTNEGIFMKFIIDKSVSLTIITRLSTEVVTLG